MGILKCLRVKRRIDEYFSGGIPEIEAREMFSHLEKCEGCREIFSLTEKAISDLQRIPLLEPPPSFDESVLSRLHVRESSDETVRLRELRKTPKVRHRIRAFALSYIGAFIVLAFSALSLLVRGGRRELDKGVISLGSDALERLVSNAKELVRALEYVGDVLRSFEAIEKLAGNLPGLIPPYTMLLFLVPIQIGLLIFLREILRLDEGGKA